MSIRCDRGEIKEMSSAARSVMVVHMVCGAVLGGSALTELQTALRWWCQGGFG